MRNFDISELDKWNARLKNINLALSIKSLQQKNCIFLNTIPQTMWEESKSIRCSTGVSFNFSFSVSEKTLKRFDNILDSLLSDGMLFNFFQEESYSINTQKTKSPISDFEKYLTENTHTLYKVKYQQRRYDFKDFNLLYLIYFVSCVEDTVKIIQKYFEYDVDGNEICNITYPIGTIISLVKDKSSDYIVQNTLFKRDDINNPLIIYNISKIESDLKSEVLIFSDTFNVNEEDICPNRDDRINTILN